MNNELTFENKDELKNEFIRIKKEGINLTKEFKSLVSDKLTEEERLELKAYLKERKEELKELRKEKLKELRAEYKKRRVVIFLRNRGFENAENIVANIDLGLATVNKCT